MIHCQVQISVFIGRHCLNFLLIHFDQEMNRVEDGLDPKLILGGWARRMIVLPFEHVHFYEIT